MARAIVVTIPDHAFLHLRRSRWAIAAAVALVAALAALLLLGKTRPGLPETGVAVWLPAQAAAPPILPSAENLPLTAEQAKALNSDASVEAYQGPAPEPFKISGSTASRAMALRCLTEAVYYEAATEPLEGQQAVAQVVLNRVRHPAFPNTVCGVVYQGSERATGCQFSFTCDGSLARRPVPNLWQHATQVAQRALQGAVSSRVGPATHYHANYVVPYWASSLRRVAVIGAHLFYRWPGYWGTVGAQKQAYMPDESLALERARLAELAQEAIDPGPNAEEAATDDPSSGANSTSEMAPPTLAADVAKGVLKPSLDKPSAPVADQAGRLVEPPRLGPAN